jgi:hypothetical protein
LVCACLLFIQWGSEILIWDPERYREIIDKQNELLQRVVDQPESSKAFIAENDSDDNEMLVLLFLSLFWLRDD